MLKPLRKNWLKQALRQRLSNLALVASSGLGLACRSCQVTTLPSASKQPQIIIPVYGKIYRASRTPESSLLDYFPVFSETTAESRGLVERVRAMRICCLPVACSGTPPKLSKIS